MPEKIPVMLLGTRDMEKLGRRLKPVGRFLLNLQPGLKKTLPKIGLELEPEAYCAASFVSSFFYGFILFVICLVASSRSATTMQPLIISLAVGAGTWMVFLMLHLTYPSIVLNKVAAKENKDLLFALREIIMGVDSGVPLFDSIQNIAVANYGYVSSEFSEVVRNVDGGVPEVDALRALALRTESEYLKRTVWQMVNALESGASMGGALTDMVESIEGYTYRDIENYSSTLNFLLLIYLLVASVVPSLGITLMVLLSAFSGLGVNMVTIAILVGSSAVGQIIMIGYMSSTRPELFGG
jgi:flagellar protein FlaJ